MIGFYNILKPTGVSSGYVVNRVKHIVCEKVGHLGTLDPLASGVIPVAVGKATKLFDYFLKKDKVYFAVMKFGVLTDTLDSEGKVLERNERQVSLEEVKKASQKLVGEIEQLPPLYSARSVNGVRAYKAAKANKNIVLEKRKTQIYSINVKKWHQNNCFSLKIHCSAGTYVRSIVRDIAQILNTIATTVAIIRLESGPFKIEQSVLIEQLENDKISNLIPINDVLKNPSINLSNEQAKALFSGKTIDIKSADGEYLCFYEGEEFSLALVKNNKLENKIYFYDRELTVK